VLERNPVTHARHRREVFWQITLPLIIGTVLCALLGALAVAAPMSGASQWADISLIWLILIGLTLSFVLAVFLFAGFYIVTFVLLPRLPIFFYRAYGWILMFGAQLDHIQSKSVEPFLRVHSFGASLREIGRAARRK